MIQLRQDANGGEVSFRVGETFEILLPETRTTGYKWIAESKGEPALTLVNESANAPQGPPGCAGTHLWKFEAAMPGTASVVLHYRRPWEAGAEPGRVFELHASVTN